MASGNIPRPIPVIPSTELTPTYDSTKISEAVATINGKIVSGRFVVKANALSSGSNTITWSIPDVAWATRPVVSYVTSAIADDSKNYNVWLTGSSANIRASEPNSGEIHFMFIGFCL